ncbi:tRNA pseudouridine(38-40) synthase TruA [Faecalimonas sp.]
MRNYKMIIAYDGTKYQGWQRQSSTPLTIQGILETTISEIVGYFVEIDGSGRTDRGVHAIGQVANVKLAGKIEERKFQEQLNKKLPEDIRIRQIKLVPNCFHSRLSAVAKTYEYVVDTREKPNVFTRKYCYHYTKTLDVQCMQEAAKKLVGRHDFSAFTDKKDEKSAVRILYNIKIEKHGYKIYFRFYGNGFMYHEVRILAGTLLEVGTGERTIQSISEALQSKNRSDAGFLAPALGLVLKKVEYK